MAQPVSQPAVYANVLIMIYSNVGIELAQCEVEKTRIKDTIKI
jgi:hypothetical protein